MMRICTREDIRTLHARADAESREIGLTVTKIIQDVREKGDEALHHYTERFDGVRLNAFRVTEEEIDTALREADSDFVHLMRQAAENITVFHEKQKRHGYAESRVDGVLMGQRVLPLDRVGIYVPGGTANYSSTVLMNAIPAKIAGVGEVLIATPPDRDGKVNANILAAASVAGVHGIYKMGGAQAIAAFAYGTKSVPRVDKITGPGNVYVATAKKQVFGQCAIDMVAGPSEILVIADDTANPAYVAADLLSQAEHDARSASILITDSEVLAKAVQTEVERQLRQLPRREIASHSIENFGRILIAVDLAEAADISNEIAPEHLELMVADPFALMGRIRHAGSVFLGHYAPEALGDYFAGPNHTLPTSGTARFSSPLGVDDFVKRSSFIYYSRDALERVHRQVERFAREEGLDAHERSMAIRFEEE